jgi:hypothetical protein
MPVVAEYAIKGAGELVLILSTLNSSAKSGTDRKD